MFTQDRHLWIWIWMRYFISTATLVKIHIWLEFLRWSVIRTFVTSSDVFFKQISPSMDEYGYPKTRRLNVIFDRSIIILCPFVFFLFASFVWSFVVQTTLQFQRVQESTMILSKENTGCPNKDFTVEVLLSRTNKRPLVEVPTGYFCYRKLCYYALWTWR